MIPLVRKGCPPKIEVILRGEKIVHGTVGGEGAKNDAKEAK
jgi:hypothetical protein